MKEDKEDKAARAKEVLFGEPKQEEAAKAEARAEDAARAKEVLFGEPKQEEAAKAEDRAEDAARAKEVLFGETKPAGEEKAEGRAEDAARAKEVLFGEPKPEEAAKQGARPFGGRGQRPPRRTSPPTICFLRASRPRPRPPRPPRLLAPRGKSRAAARARRQARALGGGGRPSCGRPVCGGVLYLLLHIRRRPALAAVVQRGHRRAVLRGHLRRRLLERRHPGGGGRPARPLLHLLLHSRALRGIGMGVGSVLFYGHQQGGFGRHRLARLFCGRGRRGMYVTGVAVGGGEMEDTFLANGYGGYTCNRRVAACGLCRGHAGAAAPVGNFPRRHERGYDRHGRPDRAHLQTRATSSTRAEGRAWAALYHEHTREYVWTDVSEYVAVDELAQGKEAYLQLRRFYGAAGGRVRPRARAVQRGRRRYAHPRPAQRRRRQPRRHAGHCRPTCAATQRRAARRCCAPSTATARWMYSTPRRTSYDEYLADANIKVMANGNTASASEALIGVMISYGTSGLKTCTSPTRSATAAPPPTARASCRPPSSTASPARRPS